MTFEYWMGTRSHVPLASIHPLKHLAQDEVIKGSGIGGAKLGSNILAMYCIASAVARDLGLLALAAAAHLLAQDRTVRGN